LKWRGPKGEEREADWGGCITQLNSKGKVRGRGRRKAYDGNILYNDVKYMICDPSTRRLGAII